MAVGVGPLRGQDTCAALRALVLVWQDPDTRAFVRVGRLREDEHADGKVFTFSYEDSARHLQGFSPLPEFPAFGETYQSPTLPVFFANRVMSSRRASYPKYVGWLGLDDLALPMEILARSGGGRETDTYHVVEDFSVRDGARDVRFFSSGLSHVREAHESLVHVHRGQALQLVEELDNPHDHLSLRIHDGQVSLGWVPRWLNGSFHEVLRSGGRLDVSVEQVNLDAPPHLQLLCHAQIVD